MSKKNDLFYQKDTIIAFKTDGIILNFFLNLTFEHQ